VCELSTQSHMADLEQEIAETLISTSNRTIDEYSRSQLLRLINGSCGRKQ